MVKWQERASQSGAKLARQPAHYPGLRQHGRVDGRADCIVTKAGPGTIAEAATRGLPCLLSSPRAVARQVRGRGGVRRVQKKPAKIGATIAQWFAVLNLRKSRLPPLEAVSRLTLTRDIGGPLFEGKAPQLLKNVLAWRRCWGCGSVLRCHQTVLPIAPRQSSAGRVHVAK